MKSGPYYMFLISLWGPAGSCYTANQPRARHIRNWSYTGHTYSCGPAPGSVMLCLGRNTTKEKQTRIIQSRSWGVNLVRALQEQVIQMQPQAELIG